MYNNNSRNRTELKNCRTLQPFRKLKDSSTSVGYYSYTKRYLSAR